MPRSYLQILGIQDAFNLLQATSFWVRGCLQHHERAQNDERYL